MQSETPLSEQVREAMQIADTAIAADMQSVITRANAEDGEQPDKDRGHVSLGFNPIFTCLMFPPSALSADRGVLPNA